MSISLKENTKVFLDKENLSNKLKTQILSISDSPAFENSQIRIMPDAHYGKGVCIGFTGKMQDKVIPNVVGKDIGCGMFTVNLGQDILDTKEKLKNLDEFINNDLDCMVYNHAKNLQYVDKEFLNKLKNVCNRLNFDFEKQKKKLGTLGGGNHFIEVDKDNNGNRYLIIHSGSRNFGARVSTYWQQKASTKDKRHYDKESEKLINKLKKEDKYKEIEDELEKLKKEINAYNDKIPNSDLAYLEGKKKEDYIKDLRVAQKYARLSREIMATKIVEEHLGLDMKNLENFQTTHNYIGKDNIIRKGAISARKGEKVLIPINMKEGCIIGKGKGNKDWNYSAPHGAGRVMGRREAHRKLKFKDFQKEMKDAKIYSSSVKESTLDEAPGAYKPIELILKHIKDTISIEKRIKPVYNFKNSN